MVFFLDKFKKKIKIKQKKEQKYEINLSGKNVQLKNNKKELTKNKRIKKNTTKRMFKMFENWK